MDCDDSEFQSQNFQIIGEDNDGFPQSLQSYDPPKFDIDDHFQSHLRFDSLAESRLFLGIQGEENNWIEEFSPRHSASEFGSIASQTCSIVGNDVWSNTPSEIAQMLVKSIGDNEVDAQNMNTESETLAIEDSAKNTQGLNEDVATAKQHGVSLQTPNNGKSESVLNINSSDQKYHSVGEVVASESTVNEEVTSSSIEAPKACLVADELLEVVHSKDQLDNSSVISSFVDCGYAINKSCEMSPISVQSNIQNDSLPLFTDNASTKTNKLENSLITEQKKEDFPAVNVNESSESPQSENKQSDTFPNFHSEHKLNDHKFQNESSESLNNDVCVVKDSSGIAPTVNSQMLSNEGSHDTGLSENSGLLEAIAYQVKSLNKDLEDKRSTCTSQLTAVALDVGNKFIEVVIEKRTELCDIAAEPINSSSLGLEESQTLCSEEQRDLDVPKRVIDDNKWKIEFSPVVQTKISAVEDDTGSEIHPLTTHNLDSMQREKIDDNECLEAFTENSDKLNGAEITFVNKPSALLEDTENKASSVHEKLDPMIKTVCLVAESNVDNFSHLEEKDNSTQSGGSSDNDLKNHSSTTETTQLSASETQDHGIMMDIDETSIKDQAENTQLLHSEVEVIVEEKEVIVSSIPDSQSDGKDVQVASLSAVKCVTDSEILGEQHMVPDSDVKGPSVESFSDEQGTTKTGEGEVAFSAGAYALSTCNSTEGENANLASTNNSDKPKQTDIELDTSNIGTNDFCQLPLPESNLNSFSFDPQGGKPCSYETNCGSPTVISCNEWNIEERSSTQDRERNSSLQNLTGSSLEASKYDRCKGNVQDSKMSSVGNDGNFTFIVPLDKSDPPEESKKDQEFISQSQFLEQHQISREVSQEHPNETVKEATSMSMEDKKKQASTRRTRKAGISKGDANENSQEKYSKGSKRTPRSTSGRASRNKTGNEDVQQCLYVDSNTKSSCSPNVQTSNLPDTSTSAPLLFHQPFTDLQQIQLRAQIFVYGSLIQGVLPDEACMLPAFGGTDGGRSLWEKTWRVASERFHIQKSLTNSSEQGASCSLLSSKVLNCSSGRRDSKTPIAATKSSIVSFQSPFQSSSKDVLPSNITRGTYLESNQSPSPLHPYQTSQMRPYSTNSAPWFSPSPHHASWVVPSQSSPFDSAAIASEIAQVTPARDSSKSLAANLQLTSTGALLPRQDTPSISSSLPSEIQNKEATPVGNKNPSIREKSRKRKKISALEESVLNISGTQPQRDSAHATCITSNLPSSSSFPLSSSSLCPNTSVGFVSTTSQTPTVPYYQILGSNSQQKVLSKETCTHIEQSKVQADSASAYAATAIKHSQTIWEQMTAQKSGLASEVEGKLASAAVAAAAAASVAKAAAEVAKVASEAAIQAKLMADEAVNLSYAENATQNTENSLDIGKGLLNLPGKENSLSVISAAREATRRRVEASSAAMKRAENLDAILKAAEMAAEAVSQVGTIIAMGDPLPLSISELVEAGPDDYWKRHHMTMKIESESYSQAKKNSGLHMASDHELHTKQSAELLPSDHNKRQNSMLPGNQKSILFEEHYEGHELQDRENIVSTETGRNPIQGSTIQTGSLVEVVAEEGDLRGAWFSAFVLDIKDGKAYVQYKDLPSAEGHDKPKEWIPLEFKGDQPPRIRVAHTVLVGIPEGTRKRRREALGNFNWAVGDRIDAWMRDGWWEGVVTEKNPDDETKLTVHFTAGGDSSVVRAWNLRPSLSWEDGRWIEWSHTKEKITLETYEGDTPQEKRRKLGLLDNKNKEEIIEGGLNTHTNDSSKLEETNQLNLSARDAIFSLGKNVGDDNNNDAFKIKRAGLQKDGSKVVFGVPKPGKRRKFMEVSKHYTADKIEKTVERSDSIKFAKYLIPQAPQPWRNNSKADTKGKQGTNLNTRILKSSRPQNVQTKSTMDKDKSFTSASVSNGVDVSLKTSFNTGEKKSSLEVGSLPHIIGKVDVAVLGPSVQHVPAMPARKKKSSSLEVEIGGKEKGSSVVDQSSRSEVQGSENIVKRSADIIEPRRSNRRIQPTSRLLEGLQSSLLISKIPSFLHDKSTKTLQKGGPSSRGQSHR